MEENKEKTFAEQQKAKNDFKKRLPTILFLIAFLAWPVLHWFVFNGYVNFGTLYNSFFSWKENATSVPEIGFTLNNYKKLFELMFDANSGENYPLAFSNLGGYLIFNNFILLPISLVVAFALSKKVFMGEFFQALYFFPSLISIVALVTAWKEMWNADYGVFSSIAGALGINPDGGFFSGSIAQPMILLYCLWTGIGWNNLILSGAMHQVPTELYEAAELDGANAAQQLWHVTIPSVWPTINTLIVMGTANSFTVFLQAQMLAKFEGVTLAMIVVDKVNALDYGLASASGLLVGVFGFIVVSIIRKILTTVDEKMGY